MKTTHVVLILDRSGSMSSSAEEAVNNYNDQVRAFKKMAEETAGTAEIKVSLITFNEHVFEHLWEVPAADMQLCKQGDFDAEGWTAMLDGIGYSIEKMRETTDCNNPDNSYLFVIITDGQENKSKHYVWTQSEATTGVLPLNEVMKPLEDSGRWTFSFMGCDKNYLTHAAKALNVPMANVALWDNHTAKGASFGYRNSSKRIHAATMNLCRGASSVNNLYSDSLECADFCADDADVPDLSLNTPIPNVAWNNAGIHPANINAVTGDAGVAVFSNGTKANWKC